MSESGLSAPRALAHRVVRMTGRDPTEPHRAATPLELLFDLTFVVGFGVVADQLAHLLAGTAVVLAAAVWMAAAGVPMAWCLLVVTLAPAVSVVGYEALGYRHLAAVLERSRSGD